MHIRIVCARQPLSAQTLGLFRRVRPRTSSRVQGASRDEQNGASTDLEAFFAKELERRGLKSAEDTQKPGTGPEEPKSKVKVDESAKTGPPPIGGQLDRSRSLSSEGLEGLIPRASLLLQLGGTFFIGFLPLIAAVILLFGGLYLGFGESFIHTNGEVSRPPAYVDPYELLNEPTVDPYYPVR